MKFKFKIDGLDCANCSAKIERGISAIDGVDNASVNFLTTKMIIECEENRIDEIMSQALKIISRVEPDAKVIKA